MVEAQSKLNIFNRRLFDILRCSMVGDGSGSVSKRFLVAITDVYVKRLLIMTSG